MPEMRSSNGALPGYHRFLLVVSGRTKKNRCPDAAKGLGSAGTEAAISVRRLFDGPASRRSGCVLDGVRRLVESPELDRAGPLLDGLPRT
jgi:hypothetical protein